MHNLNYFIPKTVKMAFWFARGQALPVFFNFTLKLHCCFTEKTFNYY